MISGRAVTDRPQRRQQVVVVQSEGVWQQHLEGLLVGAGHQAAPRAQVLLLPAQLLIKALQIRVRVAVH